MGTTLPTVNELYTLFKNEVESRQARLNDWNEGSINDCMAGISAVASAEILRILIEKFNKTYFATAHGPEITGGADDLEFLAKDHFGDDFARPEASKSTGIVTFSRANTDAGNCTIPALTVVKTAKDANGEERRFEVESAVIMSGLTVNATVNAIVAGSEGNVGNDTVTVIESSLTDPSITVNNSLAFGGGEPEEDDATYRETIRNKIETIRGATLAAIKAAALVVPGIEMATAIESMLAVKAWNIGGDAPIGAYFYIPYARLYVADANGGASDALIQNVVDAIEPVRAAGARIEVLGAEAFLMDWEASITLNPAGPNYSELQNDPQMILDTMEQYVKDLPIGTGFNKILARLAMIAIWGPSGTNDLTDFIVNEPSGNLAVTEVQKLIPDTMSIV